MTNQALLQRSLTSVWHPCSQMKQHESLPLVPIARGEGVWLTDFDGKRYLDAVSSWWVNLFGHCNPRINAALRDQLDQLEHVILAGFTHQPVVELSERLARLSGLGHAFYGSDGASATEIALKMSFHYWRNSGRPEKNRFVSLHNGYHGETVGALSVTDVALFKDTYAPLLRASTQLPTPDWRLAEPGESARDYALRCAAALRAHFERHHADTAALILEPLVQGAAGMAMYHAEYLRQARALCDEFEVHLIADEIAVGFGRTGTMFAWDQVDALSRQHAVPTAETAPPSRPRASPPVSGGAASCRTGTLFAWDQAFPSPPAPLPPAGEGGESPSPACGGGVGERVKPDFLCLSKGITGGYLPLSAVLTSDSIYQAFYHDDTARGFLHSHSYTGNALACRAALAVLDIFEQDGVIEANCAKAAVFDGIAEPLRQHPRVRNYRHLGMIWAFEVAEAPAGFARRCFEEGLKRGLLLRPIGSTVYFMPPYVISAEEFGLLVAGTLDILEKL